MPHFSNRFGTITFTDNLSIPHHKLNPNLYVKVNNKRGFFISILPLFGLVAIIIVLSFRVYNRTSASRIPNAITIPNNNNNKEDGYPEDTVYYTPFI